MGHYVLDTQYYCQWPVPLIMTLDMLKYGPQTSIIKISVVSFLSPKFDQLYAKKTPRKHV